MNLILEDFRDYSKGIKYTDYSIEDYFGGFKLKNVSNDGEVELFIEFVAQGGDIIDFSAFIKCDCAYAKIDCYENQYIAYDNKLVNDSLHKNFSFKRTVFVGGVDVKVGIKITLIKGYLGTLLINNSRILVNGVAPTISSSWNGTYKPFIKDAVGNISNGNSGSIINCQRSGSIVNFDMYLALSDISNLSSTSYFTIEGLPYTSNIRSVSSISIGRTRSVAFELGLFGEVVQNSKSIKIYRNRANNSYLQLRTSEIQNDTYFYISGSYFVSE